MLQNPESGPLPAFESSAGNEYRCGMLAGREFLVALRDSTLRYRLFGPSVLRAVLEMDAADQSKGYQDGFLDAIGAYILQTLAGRGWIWLLGIRAARSGLVSGELGGEGWRSTRVCTVAAKKQNAAREHRAALLF